MIVTAIAGALAPSTSSGDLVKVVTIVGVGVCLRHNDISFVVYRSMLEFLSIPVTVIVTSYKF